MGHPHSIQKEELLIDDVMLHGINRIRDAMEWNQHTGTSTSMGMGTCVSTCTDTKEIEKLNKQVKVLECRNRLLSELLKAETSNYNSLRRVADDLLLENKMLRKSAKDRHSYDDDDNDNESDTDALDPIVILGLMTMV